MNDTDCRPATMPRVGAPRGRFAMVSLLALLGAGAAVASARATDLWGGRALLVVAVLTVLLGGSALFGIAALWQRPLRWLGAGCALLSLYLLWITISGVRAL